MGKFLWLPAATRNEHARSNSWSDTTSPKGCLHTTEGSDWPTYSDWTIMPHGTVKPKPGVGVEIRQHLPLNQASFSLRNLDGGVQTNRDYVFQWELIGTSEKGGPGYYWPDADEPVLTDLYEKLIEPLSAEYDIPLTALTFQAYPASYGARGVTNTVRLSGSGFDRFSGWLGHQHVPENVHGDPGAFPWTRMMEAQMALNEAQTTAAAKAGALAALDAFLDVRSIPNLPLDPADPQGADWKLRDWAAKQDRAADMQNANLATVVTNQTAILAGLAGIAAAQTELKALVGSATGADPASVTAAINAGVAKIDQAFANLHATLTIN
jgi:hypothetical protein